MKIEIEKRHTTTETVDIELPYYFAINCDGEDFESTVFGKVEAERTITIAVRSNFGASDYSFELELFKSTPERFASDGYFAPDCKSTKANFEFAEQLVIKALQS